MKKGYVTALIVVSVILFIFLSIKAAKTTIEPFNALPRSCEEISNSLYIIPDAKLGMTYKTKIVIYREYSATEHRRKHPEDIAICTGVGDKSNMVIVLTNNNPYEKNYFVTSNVAVAAK